MYHPTTRLLTVLELLQSHREISGAEIARRLQVNPRTVRRYIMMLQDMGIPVEGERGRTGAYYLAQSFKLPPLMFTNDEVLTLILSLQVAQQTLLTGSPVAVEGALAKIERVLPEVLRQQSHNLTQTLAVEVSLPQGIPASPAIIAVLSTALKDRRKVKLSHQSRDGEETERVVEPYGIAYRVGRWYTVCYCHLRNDIRTFRIDRIASAILLDEPFQQPPAAINIMTYVEQALASTPGVYKVEVLFEASLDETKELVPAALGQFTPTDSGVMLVCWVQNLAWIAGFLAGVALPIQIIAPEALKLEMYALLERVRQSLDRGSCRLEQAD